MSDPTEPTHTHKVNIGSGYPTDPYASTRFVMSETFDAAMTRTVPEVPGTASEAAIPERKVRIFSPEMIADAVEKGHLIPLAMDKKKAASSATKFGIELPNSVTNGTAFDVKVTAQDENGNVVTNYAGTAHLASSGEGTLPGDHVFVAADNGTHAFSVNLVTNGLQSIVVGDGSITGTADVIVSAAKK
jgi:hypothetical protein